MILEIYQGVFLPKREVRSLKDLERIKGTSIPIIEEIHNEVRDLNVSKQKVKTLTNAFGFSASNGHVVKLYLRTPFSAPTTNVASIWRRIDLIPKSIQNLPYLQILDLSRNALTELPEEIGKLSQLRELILDDNQLKNLPDSIVELSNLQILSFKRNEVQNIPNSIGNLKSLNDLGFSENRVKFLPESIGKLTNLVKLTLFDNNIDSLPKTFVNLKSLKVLEINGDISSNIPSMIAKLPKLEDLSVDISRTTLFPEDLCKIKTLKNLVFEGGILTEIPEAFGNLVSLEKVEIGLSRISILPESIGNLKSLKSLSFWNNNLNSLPNSIKNLKNLEELVLGYNKFTEIPESICSLVNLKKLDLGDNELISLDKCIGNLKFLEELLLDHNKLKNLPESSKNLKKLKRLTLDHNEFSKLPLFLWKMKELKTLTINNNPFIGEWEEILNSDFKNIMDFLRIKSTFNIFVSHAVADYHQYKIKDIVDFLESHEDINEAFFCEEDLKGNIDEFMDNTIPKCHIMIFIATKNSVFNSIDCTHEIELAVKNKIPIIIIKGQDIEKHHLKDIQTKTELLIEFNLQKFNDFCKELMKKIEFCTEKIKIKSNTSKSINLNEQLTEIREIIEEYLFTDDIKEIVRENSKIIEKLNDNYRYGENDELDYVFEIIKLLEK